MRRVFADTFYWVARANPYDQWHSHVIAAKSALGDLHFVTTDEVLVEFLAAIAGQGGHQRQRAVRLVRELLADSSATVLPQTRESFLDGLQLYERRADKAYSLTDCISMCAMRQHGLSDILTNDAHFIQEGFNALFRSSPRR